MILTGALVNGGAIVVGGLLGGIAWYTRPRQVGQEDGL